MEISFKKCLCCYIYWCLKGEMGWSSMSDKNKPGASSFLLITWLELILGKRKKNNGKQTSWKRILWRHSWKAYKLILYLLAGFKLCRTDKVSCKLKFSNYLATSFIVHFSAMSIRPNASLAKTRVLHGQVYRSLSYTFCKLLSLLLLLLLLLLYCCCYCCGYFCCPLFTPSKSFDRKSPKSRNLDYLEKFLT